MQRFWLLRPITRRRQERQSNEPYTHPCLYPWTQAFPMNPIYPIAALWLVWMVLIWRALNRCPRNCAWNPKLDRRPHVSHTICRRHKREMIAEARRERSVA